MNKHTPRREYESDQSKQISIIDVIWLIDCNSNDSTHSLEIVFSSGLITGDDNCRLVFNSIRTGDLGASSSSSSSGSISDTDGTSRSLSHGFRSGSSLPPSSSSVDFFLSIFGEWTGDSMVNGAVSIVSCALECVERGFFRCRLIDNNDDALELILSERVFLVIDELPCVIFDEFGCEIDSIDNDREGIWLLDIQYGYAKMIEEEKRDTDLLNDIVY